MWTRRFRKDSTGAQICAVAQGPVRRFFSITRGDNANNNLRFWGVFYIDATSRETITTGLTALAKAAKAGGSPEEGLKWLASQQERWLLVFNNADDPKVNLREFFPACTNGDILITTRNQEMRAHTQGTKSFYQVSSMLPDDARELLLKASGASGEQKAASTAATLVTVCALFSISSDCVAKSALGSWLLCTRNCPLRSVHSCDAVWTC